jgi:pimeloyl-ACP methyl ester carboxylesterase
MSLFPDYATAQLKHGTTRYIEAGTGEPVILIHGSRFQSSADDWRPNIPTLASRFRVFAPDCMGWPPSDHLDEEYSFAYLTDFIREFQDVMGLKNSHIVGASMGGWVAGLLAYESPDRILKCVQTGHNGINALPNPGMTNWNAPGKDAIQAWLANVLKGTADDMEDGIHARVDEMVNPTRISAFAKVMRHMGDGATRSRYDLAPRLPFTTVPTLYIWGSQDASFKVAETARDLTPGAKLVVLDCGHDVSLEMPEQFNQAILDFLS